MPHCANENVRKLCKSKGVPVYHYKAGERNSLLYVSTSVHCSSKSCIGKERK